MASILQITHQKPPRDKDPPSRISGSQVSMTCSLWSAWRRQQKRQRPFWRRCGRIRQRSLDDFMKSLGVPRNLSKSLDLFWLPPKIYQDQEFQLLAVVSLFCFFFGGLFRSVSIRWMGVRIVLRQHLFFVGVLFDNLCPRAGCRKILGFVTAIPVREYRQVP